MQDRASYNADSGIRSSDRESAAGECHNLSDACDNAIDSDSISLLSSHHNMNHCKLKGIRKNTTKYYFQKWLNMYLLF